MQDKLRIIPCSIERANSLVSQWHRHHKSVSQARFALAVVDHVQQVRGVAIVGRPVARILDNGWTLEVNRVATDGCPNACSALYGASRRVAKELGYAKLITYIRKDEPGTSLRAAGWIFEQPIRARSWNMPGRSRVDKTEIVERGRWSVILNDPIEAIWPVEDDPGQLLLCYGNGAH